MHTTKSSALWDAIREGRERAACFKESRPLPNQGLEDADVTARKERLVGLIVNAQNKQSRRV